jgi:tetratricopeptide (TPR) repeat protein
MRRLFGCQFLVLLLAGMAAAQSDNSSQNGQSPVNPPTADSTTRPEAGETPATSTTTKPSVTVTAPRHEQPLPVLPPDEFVDCMAQSPRVSPTSGRIDPIQMVLCDAQQEAERHIVVEACVNPKGDTAPPRAIQACTVLLDRKVLEGGNRFPLYENRARAYFAQDDKPRALDDYNEAVKLAPRNAKVYYGRGVFYALQSDDDAALRDFDTAIRMDSKSVLALRQRAKIYQARGDYISALADYSQAIRLQPKTALLWSERGYVCLRQQDYESAAKNEGQAIQLDPKLARAYFLRGAAFGDLGDSRNAVSDLVKAVDLDPSLGHYITSKGKSATIALPPL